MEIDHKHSYKLHTKCLQVSEYKYGNSVNIFEVMCNKYNVDKICTYAGPD